MQNQFFKVMSIVFILFCSFAQSTDSLASDDESNRVDIIDNDKNSDASRITSSRVPLDSFYRESIAVPASHIPSYASSFVLHEDDRRDGRKIGIEIETLMIKAPFAAEMNVIIKDELNNTYIIIEPDTTDKSFQNDSLLKIYQANLELKTFGGSNEEELKGKLAFIIKIIRNILARASHPVFENPDGAISIIDAFTADMLEGKKLIETGSPMKIVVKLPKKTEGEAPKQPTTFIRPQITYQIPLEKLYQLFYRLRDLGHKQVQEFLQVIEDGENFVPENLETATNIVNEILKENEDFNSGIVIPRLKKIAEAKTERRISRRHGNLDKVRERIELEKVFATIISPRFKNIPNQKVKNFCLLVYYYWYSLFNNKFTQEKEPGLKQHLAIMSRMPFSQLFDELTIEEQEQFKEVMSPIIDEYGVKYKVRSYINYEGEEVNSRLTLKEWYDSIVSRDKRNQSIFLPRGKLAPDLLSPPMKLFDRYITDSMGKQDLRDSPGLPLFEARGYAKLPFNEESVDISNIEDYIIRETNWFFNGVLTI